MSYYAEMPAALRSQLQKQKKTLREIAETAHVSPSTVMSAMNGTREIQMSTLVAIWNALGFKVAIYCQDESRNMYIFEEGQ